MQPVSFIAVLMIISPAPTEAARQIEYHRTVTHVKGCSWRHPHDSAGAPRACYCGFVDNRARHITPSNPDQPASPSLQELAIQQRVAPIDEFESLLGTPSPEDESAEEFAARLREWRREGPAPARTQ